MANESPALVIVDPSGSNIATVNSDGKLQVNTAFSSSLPSGSNPLGQVGIKTGESGDLSLETTQLSISSSLSDISSSITNLALEATQQDISSSLVSIRDTVTLEATQLNISSSLTNLISIVATQATLAAVSSSLALLRTEVAKEITQLVVSSSLEAIRLTDGVAKIRDSLPSGTNNIGYFQLIDPSGEHVVNIYHDPIDGFDRLRIEGKVSIVAPVAPSGTTPVTIVSSGSLGITSTSGIDDVYYITSGKTFTLQQIIAGSEGDATEAGSVVEIFYGTASVDNLVERVYVNGFSTEIYPNTSITRKKQSMTGSGGGRIILRRRRLSGGSQELDAVLRGFES